MFFAHWTSLLANLFSNLQASLTQRMKNKKHQSSLALIIMIFCSSLLKHVWTKNPGNVASLCSVATEFFWVSWCLAWSRITHFIWKRINRLKIISWTKDLSPLHVSKKGNQLKISHYQTPEEVLDDSNEIITWANMAFSATLRSASKKHKPV